MIRDISGDSLSPSNSPPAVCFRAVRRALMATNGLELSCPAEAGNSPLLYGLKAGETRRS